MRHLTIALDAMGGDFGPVVTVPASLQALNLYPELELLLVGKPAAIKPLLIKADSVLLKRLTIVPALSVISSNDKPLRAIRANCSTSMRISLELIKEGRAQICISAGNTGALMGLARLLLKPINGIKRPALVAILPHQKHGKTVVLDLGANLVCDETMLVQFAVMGTVIAEHIVGMTNPRVALLNIGKEEGKGPDPIQHAAALLGDLRLINYVGYLEANELLMGRTDVLVCDGFIGNITLKSIEGAIRVVLSSLQSFENSGRRSWLIQRIKQWVKRRLICQFDYLHPDQYNGACLIGLYGTIIKSHGAANQLALTAAIEQGMQLVERQIPEQIAARLDVVLPKSN